jgi:hypothetical protein
LRDFGVVSVLVKYNERKKVMNKIKVFEYLVVVGVWATFVYYVVRPIFPDRFTSVTIFVLLVPLVIYWVLRERLLAWDGDNTRDR